MGDTAVSESKLGSGNPLVVLGVEISLADDGVTFWPSKDKVHKWRGIIRQILDEGKFTSGEASKLSGRFQWGGQVSLAKSQPVNVLVFSDLAGCVQKDG